MGIPGPQVIAGGFGGVALVADLNRDGYPDVVLGASRTGPGGITVLLGDRAGGFQPPALYDSSSFYANGLAAGDLLGNGNPDVVTVAWGPAGPVHILFNRAGDGLLDPPIAFDAGPGGLGVAIGDINEDGHADIVLASGNLGVSILWGGGSGSFTGPAVYPVPLFADGVAIADLNNDGHPDIVAGTTGAISVMLGIGDGGFSGAVSYVGGGEAILPYDLNGDGLLDIVAASPLALGDEVDVFWNVGNGTLSGPTRNVFVPVDAVMGLGVSDLNGDGRPDIAASLLNSGARILRNLGDGGFAQDQYLVLGDAHFAALGLAKFTGGALADIFLSSSYASSSVLLPNDGHGVFPLPLPLLSSGPDALAVADVDGDGRPDVITPGSVFFNDAGFPSTRVDFVFPSGVSNIAVADLDGDGRPDIVAGGAEVYVALNDAGTFPLVIAYPPAVSSISAVALGDFNGDGKIDVAATGATEGLISVLVNDGSGHLLAAATFDAGAAPTGMVVVDANGDGKLDLATVNSTGNTVAVLLGSGDGRFGPPTFYSVGSAPHAIAVGDVNGDGLPDLVVGNSSSANVSILLNSGAGLKPATTLSVGVTAESVQVTDINGDGKADIAVGGIESSSLFPVVVLFLGQSSGAFERRDYAVGTPGNVPSCSPPTGNLTFSDFNADGRPDVAMTCAVGIGVQLTSCLR